MGKFWLSEACIECSVTERPDWDDGMPWQEAYDRYLHDALGLFDGVIADFKNAALAGGFEVHSDSRQFVTPFEHYTSFQLEEDSEYYVTRPFHVKFKLVLNPAHVDNNDFKRLMPVVKQVSFENRHFADCSAMAAGVEEWCKSILRHKTTGKQGE